MKFCRILIFKGMEGDVKGECMDILGDFVKYWIHLPIIIVSVFVYIYLLNLVLFKPIKKILNERQMRVEESKKMSIYAKTEWEKEIAIYEQKLSEARKEAAKIKESLRQEVLLYENKLIEDVKKEIAENKARREKEFAIFVDEIERDMKGKIPLFAEMIAEKVLKRRIAA